jgi:hypothetical protein
VWTAIPLRAPSPNATAVLTQTLGATKLVVVALIVSFSLLLGGIVGFGTKKER